MTNPDDPCSDTNAASGNVSTPLPLIVLYGLTLFAFATRAEVATIATGSALILPLVWLSIRDSQTFEIPDLATLTIAVIAVAYLAVTESTLIPRHTAAGAAVVASFWLFGEIYFRRNGHEALGIGDAKLFGAGALLLGPWKIPDLILLASFGGTLAYGFSHLRGQRDEIGIPFGPFIAYAIFVLTFLDPIFL